MGSKKPAIILFFLFFLFYYFLPLYGDNGNTIIIPLEELQSEHPLIQDLKEKVLSDDNYLQSMALYLIERSIQNKAFVPVKNEILSILNHLCNQKGTPGENKAYSHLRKKAIDLVGQLGEKTRETEFANKPWHVLLSLLHKDDIDIVSSAIFALGNMGCNNKGITIKTIALVVDKWKEQIHDFTFALAVITSIEKIAHKNNGIQDPDVYIILIKIMQGNDDKLIIDKAYEVMNLLSTY